MQVKKITEHVEVPTRALKEGWTIEEQDPFFEIGDDSLNELRESIRQQLDFEILWKVIVQPNWHWIDMEGTQEMEDWAEENISGNFFGKSYANKWAFEREEDLSMFLLRWT